MNRRTRFATTLSALAVAATLTGCVAGQEKRESIFGTKVDHQNIGLATRAQSALAAEQYATAVDLAERAVENSPNDAGFRGLLGNCYFAAGRFASAEAAFRDSLTLYPAQPEVVLKLALVEIAQGRDSDALSLLSQARNMLEPSNLGLALALAGRPADAVQLLNDIARQPGADARVRQNLALAYGLSGDWTMARTVAAQDVPADQLDSRIQQWMAIATPQRPSDQVAMLTGVQPAADAGMPVKLALNRTGKDNQALAQAVVPQPEPQPQPQVAMAETPPPALPEPMPEPAVDQAPVSAPVIAEAAHSLIEAPAQVASADGPNAKLPPLPTRFDAPVQTASYVSISETVRRAADGERRNGKSKSVMQLGAYSSPERVTVAWNAITKRYPALRNYTPVRARFAGPKGTVWRLSVKGFASQGEAIARCERFQSRGGSCFVRSVAGDSPVQFASR